MDKFTVEYYTDSLNAYKTASSKKAFLTRSRKEVASYLEDIRWAIKGAGWLHGNRVNIQHAIEQEQELELIDKLYKEQ